MKSLKTPLIKIFGKELKIINLKYKYMLDTNFKVEKKETKSFPPLPQDLYQVELLDISSQQKPTYKTKTLPDSEKVYETVLKFQFTVLDHRELRGRNIWANFIPSFLFISGKSGKNDLYKIVEALVGHELSPEEEAKMDGQFLNGLLGSQCRIFVDTIVKGDKTFDRPSKFLPIINPLTPLTNEEKEKARVKNEKKDERKMIEEGDSGYIDPSEITF